jgi:hypothetical protein
MPDDDDDMSDLDGELRATADDIAADAARLQEIEHEKTQLDAADPRVDELSAEGEQLARHLVPKATAEREIADEAGKDS